MQTKTVEPGTHSGIARYFGLIFFFEALTALSVVFSEQLYAGQISYIFAILAIIAASLAVALCVPAAMAVVVPENAFAFGQFATLVLAVGAIVASAMFGAPRLVAAPDLPYVDPSLRRQILAAVAAATGVLALAAAVRMTRRMKGRNGAFILLAGLSLALAFGVLWARLEPVCKRALGEPWPSNCLLPSTFDHNFMLVVVTMLANVLAAEGVLRLMAAGQGEEGYVEIPTVIET